MGEIAPDAQRPRTSLTLAGDIRRRLLVGFVISSLVSAGAVGFGLLAYLETDRAYSQVLAETSFIQDRITRLNDAVGAEVLHTRAYLITGDERSIASRELAHRDFAREYAELQELMGGLSDGSRLALQKLVTLHAEYDALAEDMLTLRRAGQAEEAVKLFNERSDPLVFEMRSARREVQTDIQDSVIRANRDFSTRTSQIITLVAAAFLVGAIASGWVVTRLLASSLRALDYFERALTETAQTEAIRPVRLPLSASEHHGPIFRAYNSLIARLGDGEARRLEFLEQIGHDLRSPLGSILGYAEMVEALAGRRPDADLQNYGQVIVKQAQRVGQMVENILTAAMIEEDRLEVIRVPLPLGLLLAEVVEEAKRRSGREITFENDLNSALIEGDVLHLRTVFSNLIDNAVKFSASDTPVHLSARRVPEPGWVEVTLADHGIGIAEADLPLLFHRFGRIKNEQTRGIPGSGLGLYIVKYLVQRHKGHVAARSRLGHGTAFSVRLPLGEGNYFDDEGDV